MTVNENIRRIRLQKGLTQKQVAEACGTVDAVIRTYELGKANPKPATVAKISKALGVSPAVLYGVQEDGQLSDQNTASALYQIESGGVIDAEATDKRRLLEISEKLAPTGREILIKLAEELAAMSSFRSCRTVAGALGSLTEEEQEQILSACHSLREAKLEKALMDQKPRKSPDALRSNAEITARENGLLADIILEALERAGMFDSDK